MYLLVRGFFGGEVEHHRASTAEENKASKGLKLNVELRGTELDHHNHLFLLLFIHSLLLGLVLKTFAITFLFSFENHI